MQEEQSGEQESASTESEVAVGLETASNEQWFPPFSRSIAWALGLVYTIGVGEFRLPDGIGVVLFYIPLIAFLFYRSSRSRFMQLVAVLSGLLTLTYALYSNLLVLCVADLALLVGLLTLIHDASYKSRIESVRGFCRRMFDLLLQVVQRTPENLRAYFATKSGRGAISASTVNTIFIALFGVVLFHIFFAAINQEYATVMSAVIERCIELIQYLFDVSFLIAWFVQGFCVFILLRLPESEARSLDRLLPAITVNHLGVISPMVILTAIFSVFQIKLLFLVHSLLNNFKDFSLYVQRGFWELLVVASIGFAFWLWAYRECEGTKEKRGLRVLLAIFLGELFALCIFAGHKLFLLQLVFGLKDQRLFASLAVVLVATSLIASAAVLWNKYIVADLLELQVILLLGSVCAFSLINVDAVVTSLHPISFDSEQTGMTKDYSYLLTNSFDNVDSWSSLIAEVQANPEVLKHPQAYYWGRYFPLCFKQRNRFELHLGRAKSRMQFTGGSEDIRTALRLNLATVKVNRWMKREEARIAPFSETIMNHSCPAQSAQ